MKLFRRKKYPKPSEITTHYWLYTTHPDWSEHSRKSDSVGKWLVFVSPDKLDEMWFTVGTATNERRLGIASKCSTAKANPNARDTSKLICVYTHDYRDTEDVCRVLIELRRLGITGKLYYKESLATIAGWYKPGSASLYESPCGDNIIQRRKPVVF